MLPLVENKLDVLSTARFQARDTRRIADVANVYTYAVLSGWAEPDDLGQLTQTTLAEFLASRRRLTQPTDPPMSRLLVFDQFEELFTAHPDRWQQRQEFLGQLIKAMDEKTGSCGCWSFCGRILCPAC